MGALDKIKSVLINVAPSLATALGGPLAGIATSAIAKAVTGKPDAKPEEVVEAVVGATDPNVLLQLKQAENDFKSKMEQMGIDHEKIAADDRASARQREIEVKDWTPRVLAYLVVALTALGEGYILMHGAPTGLDGVVLGRILGTLDAALILVLSYYFGSSAGSARKTEIMGAGGTK